jgi:hypothetical protein
LRTQNGMNKVKNKGCMRFLTAFGMTGHFRYREGVIRGDLPWQISSDYPFPDKNRMSFRMEPHLSEAKGWRNEESQLQAREIF